MLVLSALIAALAALLAPHVAAAPAVFIDRFVPMEPQTAAILFVGDMMFDRSIRVAAQEHGADFLFSCIEETLFRVDAVVGNLEGPITAHDSVSVGSVIGSGENVTFTFPTSTAMLLKRHNISIVNLGNNHILNFGNDGVRETRKWLDAAEVSYFGDPLAANEEERVGRAQVHGVPLSFINWSDWTGGEKEDVVAHISAERAAGRVPIVYAHWGDEYVAESQRERDLAHAFIDAGAELVIGSHPHVVLGSELYAGKWIYYSLGNFIFDQYFNEDVRDGLALAVIFDERGVVAREEIPVYLERDRRTCVKEVEE